MSNRLVALNVLWFLSGGWAAVVLWLAAAEAARHLVGYPFSTAATKIASYAAQPFGMELGGERLRGASRRAYAVWFLFAGAWLALGHLLIAVPLFASVVGIPFGMAHLRLASVAIDPLDRCESRAAA